MKSNIGEIVLNSKKLPKGMGVSDKDKKLEVIQRELRSWLRYAYQGRVNIDKLYKKGKDLIDKITEEYPTFCDEYNHQDLRGAVAFIENLHDQKAREYHSEHKEEIYYHMRRLS